ncbi:MAG: DUF481 domain-containing protein [Victivallales bacterium]|nr:DUF481 domain-containing protein [Victivallales bacterium]
MRLGRIIASMAAIGICAVTADEIKLADGSVINGTVQQVLNGKVKIKTAFTGDLEIDQKNVSYIKTDANVNVATADGKTSGKLGEDGLQGQAAPVALSSITAIWPEGAPDPTLPKPKEGRKWKYEATVDITGRKGNTDKYTVGGGFKATMEGPDDKLVLYINGKRSREKDMATKVSKTTEKEVVGGADFERRIVGSRHSWYTRAEYEYDPINDLDPIITAAAGYGLYAVDKEDFKVRLRAGISYVYRDFISDRPTEDHVGLDASYHHELKLKELLGFENIGDLITDITYTPSFEDMDDYRIYHETSLSMPLGGSKIWALRLGVSNDYYSRVAKGKKHTDTTYFAKLVLTWDELFIMKK